MQRPRGVEITFWLMSFTNAFGLFIVSQSAKHYGFRVGVNILLVVIGYVVLCFFRQGHNWARWLVLLTAVLSLWNVRTLVHPLSSDTFTRVAPVMIALEAPLGLFLIIYLNQPALRRWFRSRNRGCSSSE